MEKIKEKVDSCTPQPISVFEEFLTPHPTNPNVLLGSMGHVFYIELDGISGLHFLKLLIPKGCGIN